MNAIGYAIFAFVISWMMPFGILEAAGAFTSLEHYIFAGLAAIATLLIMWR